MSFSRLTPNIVKSDTNSLTEMEIMPGFTLAGREKDYSAVRELAVIVRSLQLSLRL